MRAAERLETRFTELRCMGRMLPGLLRARPGSPWNASRLLEERAADRPDDDALAYAEKRLSWREVDREVNRAAHALREVGVGAGDCVALLMNNRPEFVFAAPAISRLRGIGRKKTGRIVITRTCRVRPSPMRSA